MTPKDRVRELCEKTGISVKKLEKMLGISNGTVGGWDKGNPSIENARKIANHVQTLGHHKKLVNVSFKKRFR